MIMVSAANVWTVRAVEDLLFRAQQAMPAGDGRGTVTRARQLIQEAHEQAQGLLKLLQHPQ